MSLQPVCGCGQRAVWKRKTSLPQAGHAKDFDHLCDFCWCELVSDFPACLDSYHLVGRPGPWPWPGTGVTPASMLPHTPGLRRP